MNLSNFELVPNWRNQNKFWRVCMGCYQTLILFISIGSCNSELIFGMRASLRILYKNMTSYPIISKKLFLWRHHFGTLYSLGFFKEKVWLLTPAFSVTCIGDIFVHLSTCHLSTCYLNGCLTVNRQFFTVLAEEVTNDNYWPHMVEEVCEHRMFPDLQDNFEFACSRSALNGDFR